MGSQSVRFGVLGPVALWVDGGLVEIGGTKAAILLAVLVARTNRDAPVDLLIDALWGARPPRSARDLVRWHVHRLRRLLPDGGRIAHRADGYRLVAEAADTDTGRFERLYAAGREATSACRFEAAAGHYTEALRLWRGPAYAGVADTAERLRGEANRLDELRLAVLEHRVAADLELGRHEAVADELPATVAEHPLRETLRAQLMIALQRAGRRGEALEVYRSGRQALVDELGLEPGPELRRLHQTILAGGTPPGRHRSTVSAAPRRPKELPAAPVPFRGRERQVGELEAVAGLWPVLAVSGPGGVGKSALVRQLGQRIAGRFPDGQCWVDLHGCGAGLTAYEVVLRVLRSLGAEPADPHGLGVDELAARYRSATDGRRVLVVLDDAPGGEQVRPVLPGAGSALLVTSRPVLSSLPNARHHRLGPLSRGDSLRLLADLVGEELVCRDRVAAAAVADLTDGLPAALTAVAARLTTSAGWSLSELAARLREPDRRLDELADDEGGVRERFAASYRRLPPDAAWLFRSLSRFDGPVEATAVAMRTGFEPAGCEWLLDQVADVQLAERLPGRRYRLLGLVRLFARERARSEGLQRPANVRPIRLQPAANAAETPS